MQRTTCFKDNCCVKILLAKSSLSKGFAFITAPDCVCTELIKLNGTDFELHHFTIEEALVKPKRTDSSPSNKKKAAIKIYQPYIEEIPVSSRWKKLFESNKAA